MASPAVSTPSSAGSPAALAPAPPLLSMKTTMAHDSPLPTPGIMTSKEWTIPPRPKPGRKPATDTPPTKRKAQNRAAQRAFRERRAARVGELEDQLEEAKEAQEKRENDMRNKIIRLEADVHRFSNEVQSWKVRSNMLERMAEYERVEKDAALRELSYIRNGALTTGTDAVPLPPRRNRQPVPIPRAVEQLQHPSPPAEASSSPPFGCGNCTTSGPCACIDDAFTQPVSGCGNCTPESHCECLEVALNDTTAVVPAESKRAHSPVIEDYPDKRPRYTSEPSTPLEIDFTEQFSSKPVIHSRSVQEPAPEMITQPPAESCGFCEAGSYCACAAAASADEMDQRNRLAPLLNEATPPPSDTDAESHLIKLPSLQPNQMHGPVAAVVPKNSCENGPGTCQQCINDPKSGMFCRSLAAARESAAAGSAVPDGCCGGNASGGGCCKSLPAAATPQPPPSLSCADTYKTLSTHQNFDEATDTLNSWVGHLSTAPPMHIGRGPMEVEAASVMRTLKFFDRRFGRG